MVTYLSIPPCQLHRSNHFSPPSWSRLPVRSAEWLACMPAGADAGGAAVAGTDRPDRLLARVELDAALQSTDRPVFGAAFDP